MLRNDKTGDPAKCPLCEGMGKREPFFDRLPFWYPFDATIVLASGSFAGSLRIEPRADFEWWWLMATATTGVFSTRMTDASGRTYENDRVNSENQWGTAQRPFPLVAPMILKMRTSLNFDLADRSAVAGNVIQLALGGFELYPLQ
ncbi:MAG: hypothetical protein V3U28_06715 [Candidatus Acidoferrales bacterium]